MCAAAMDSPTTAEEKNSFDRNPRNVNAFESCNRCGCEARYSGSAAGKTSVTVRAVSSDSSTAAPIFAKIKPLYEALVS